MYSDEFLHQDNEVLWHLIWVSTICLCPTKRTLGLYVLTLDLCMLCNLYAFCFLFVWVFLFFKINGFKTIFQEYTSARVFVLRIRVSCAFPTHCTCVEFKLRMKRESTYFETHEYSLAALKRVSTIKYAFLPLANQIVFLQRSNA